MNSQEGSGDSDPNADPSRFLFVTERIQVPHCELSFTFVRSGGPGGQNVNKVNSKAVLRWRFSDSTIPEPVRQRFLDKFGSRVTRDGDVVLTSQRYRDQLRNREDCLDKLRKLLLAVSVPPKRRKKKKPSASSIRRRRKQKEQQSQKKQLRKPPKLGDS